LSGVSWTFSGQPNNIEVITLWESELIFNSDTEITPSTMLFRGIKDETFWGYNIPIESNKYALKRFKLLLIGNKDLSADFQRSPQIATAKKFVVSGYVRSLWHHFIECITQSTGKGLMRLCKSHGLFTLPDIWRDYSRVRIRCAAENLGTFETRVADDAVLSCIYEPEIAALVTIRDLHHCPDITVHYFVLCDAGSGTVDLISCEINQTKPMVVRESVKGNGKLRGFVFLDEEFVELTRRELTPKVWNKLPKDEVQGFLNGDWEHGIKKQFYGQQKDWTGTLPSGCRHVYGKTHWGESNH
ncbi:hypothetical protein CCHL11_09314, partial [Colletotrichum chlorophyti]